MSQNIDMSRAERQFERLQQEAWQKKNRLERETSLGKASCAVCKAIASILDASDNLRAEASLGSWAELAESDCPRHRDFFPVDTHPPSSTQEIVLRKPARQYVLYIVPDLYRNEPNRAILEAPWEVLSEPTHEVQSHIRDSRALPRIVNPDYIEIGLLRQWLSACQEQHEGRCSSTEFAHTSQARPALLVDVVNQCLVDGSARTLRYVALSYVWGHVNHFMITSKNLEHFTVPGTLGEVKTLPHTIREAMALTRALDEQYLWVDALCIIQDDLNQQQQLNAMASLFANACLTIVHGDGASANAGFRGLQGISAKRNARQRVIGIDEHRQMVKPSSRQVWSASMLTPWSTRAWTFQEEICSRRVLYFAHDSVRWACRTAHWSEESDSNDCVLTYASAEQVQLKVDSPRLSQSPMPQLSEYEALVNDFNARAFTYPEDALSAFAGVATRLGSKFSGGLISGLPELFFDLCLLWRPQRRKGPPLRRLPSKPGKLSAVLPSWSWAGWSTEVTWPFTWNYITAAAAPSPVLIGDVRPFYQIKIEFYENDSERRILIRNPWASYAYPVLSLGNSLPTGWSSDDRTYSTSAQYSDYSEKLKYYTHTSDPSARFWFPIPICEIPTAPRNPKLICFTTTCGYFKLGARRRFVTTINALDNTPVGLLWPHDESDLAYISAAEEGSLIHLVAILGHVVPKDDYPSDWTTYKLHNNHADLSTRAQRPPKRIKEVYAVLWIRWDGEGKVAYRKGTGQVDREAWEHYAEKKSAYVVLG